MTLAGRVRTRILQALSKKPQSIAELSERLDLHRMTLSRHLTTLERRGLCSLSTRGPSTVYRSKP